MINSNAFSGRARLKQKGIATILMVVLIGIALTATSLGIVHSMKAAQQKQIAVHAVTNAQNSLHAGIEAFRRYLSEADAAALAGLGTGPYPIDLGAAYGDISAENIIVSTAANGSKRVSVDIISRHLAAKASAAVGLVFEIPQSGCADCMSLPGSLNFYNDLDINGNINFTGAATGENLDINVDGAVDIRNVNLSAIGVLSSTQSVYLGYGAIDVELVHANGDVRIESASSIIGEVQTKGNLVTTGNTTVTNIKANGNATVGGSGYAATINALGNISVSNGSHGTATAGGTMSWTSGGAFSQLNAVGRITVNSASTGGVMKGRGDINCTNSGWNYDSISVNGIASNCGGTPAIGQSEVITLMPAVTDVTMNPVVVDVYKLQGHANWIFSYNTSTQRIQVRVQNINGVVDGTYDVGSIDGNHPLTNAYTKAYNALCAQFTGTVCTTFVTPLTYVCMGNGGNGGGECITYDTANRKWKLDGRSAAPGIMWFDGSVNMNNGVNYTSIMATDNIDTGGNFRGYAVNYAGYAMVCEASAPHLSNSDSNTYALKFGDRYPTNLCDTTNGKLLDVAAGNIALAAGGYTPPGTTYAGGNIKLTSSNVVFGSVLAGNAFQTDYGDTHVHGYVVAANLSASSPAINQMNGSTYIDLSSMPSTYNPTSIPNMGVSGGAGSTVADGAKVLWLRYL